MLKFFFGRHSYFVRGVELAAILLALWVTYQGKGAPAHKLATRLYWILMGQYLFVLGCTLLPWYPGHRTQYPVRRGELGIEVHFLKSRVPASYILLIGSLLFLAGMPLTATLLANVLFLPIITVNLILIAFHLRDRDPLPINYYTHNWYRKEKEDE